MYFLSIFYFQEYYDDISEANHALKKGKLSGVIYFNQNFSEGMQRRIEEANFAKDSDLIASQIQVYMDFSGTYVYYLCVMQSVPLTSLKKFQ